MSAIAPDIPRRFWPYALGIAMVFLLRGVFVLALLPPLEGWDEYQHLSYVVHLDEFGERPDANRDVVPASLFPTLKRYPHSWWGLTNNAEMGGHSYRNHWQSHDQPVANQGEPQIPIYQAQHGALAYWALLPVYRISGGLEDPLSTIFFMRFANVVLGAIAVFLVAMTISKLVPRKHAVLLSLAACANPLMLMNVARIANDGLAFLLGTAVVCCVILWPTRWRWWQGLLLGLLLGLAVAAKATNIPLIPFVFIALVWRNRKSPSRWKTLVSMAFTIGTGFLIVSLPEIAQNMELYGSPISERRTVAAANAERSIRDYLNAVREFPWLGFLGGKLAKSSLWLGGWSFSRLPRFLTAPYLGLLAMGLTWVSVSLTRKKKRFTFAGGSSNASMLLLFGFMLAALVTHGLLSFMSENNSSPRTNVFYAAVVFQWAALFLQAGGKRSISTAYSLSLLLLCIIAEIYGHIVVQTGITAASNDAGERWARVSQLQPEFSGPILALASLSLSLLLSYKLLTKKQLRSRREEY